MGERDFSLNLENNCPAGPEVFPNSRSNHPIVCSLAKHQIAAEQLAKEGFDVWLIVDDKDASTQLSLPSRVWVLALRGSVMMNSVNVPGSVSTSIAPPCCLTMMSWLIDRPRPVAKRPPHH
jgi:hypothetical protein